MTNIQYFSVKTSKNRSSSSEVSCAKSWWELLISWKLSCDGVLNAFSTREKDTHFLADGNTRIQLYFGGMTLSSRPKEYGRRNLIFRSIKYSLDEKI